MVKLRVFFILSMVLLFGCWENTSKILPSSNLKYSEKYHCWPYDVNIYSFDEIEVDSLFYSYPLKSYYGENNKYKITTWSSFNEADTVLLRGMKKTLSQCDDNIQLYDQLSKGKEVYYAGIYQFFKVDSISKKKKYEKILFIDMDNKKIHVFKDINKVY